MTHNRIITISAGNCEPGQTDADRWEQLYNQCGGETAVRSALGYLSLWNWTGYPYVNIVLMGREGEMELIANYRKEDGGTIGYTIGAVWHGDHFGFHS